MNFYEETIEIYESVALKTYEKEIAFCKILIKLMNGYTNKYSIEEIRNYILFIVILYRDIFKANYRKGKSIEQLSGLKKKQVYDILFSEL